ncbi:Molybdopterin-guanine dinucleotide biosynthesis protein B [Raoultella terrigena]|uniref:Molybdopterin-guanine dinucleotide biosynthesis protein B n=1 Tax=Raoultella terrigena TaxID=577 RepID=A0A4U9D9J6_RAOTE|nr:Molybdopterin-guanine dinucleotide biosynthesis protein B [Raoultella terrigena]
MGGHRVEDLVLDKYVIAVASDAPVTTSLPQLDLNDIAQIAAFIVPLVRRTTRVMRGKLSG